MRIAPILVLLTAAFAAAAEDVPRRIAELATAEEPEVRAAAARALAKVEGEVVSRALVDALDDRDRGVVTACLKALGRRDDEVSLGGLRKSLVDFAKDPDLLSVTVVSIGEAGDVKSAGEVAGIARMAVGASRRLARAAIGALGELPAPESLAALADLLGTAQAPDSGKAGHPELLQPVLEALRGITGLPFARAPTWRDWLRHARRTWRPDLAELPSGREYENRGWRFRIGRPDVERWDFERVGGGLIRVAYSGAKEEAGFAWVDVQAHAAGEGPPATPAEAAEQYRPFIEQGLSSRKEEVYGVRSTLGRAPALRHAATGISGGGQVIRWEVYFGERNGIVYTVTVRHESGASKAVVAGVAKILGSFRYLDR